METKQFHVPLRPYSPIDELNRMSAALGSPRYAAAASTADYNGHHVVVWWNDYKGYYIAHYMWSGPQRIGRGTLDQALTAALAEYGRGALGASVAVTLREGDDAALALCEALCRDDGPLRPGKAPERPDWMTWQHDVARDAARDSANPSRYVIVFDWDLMQKCADRKAYEEALRARHGSVYGF